MKRAQRKNSATILLCCVTLAFAILCVGLFFAAAYYAERTTETVDAAVTDPSTQDRTTDTQTSSETETDLNTDSEEVSNLPTAPEPNYGEEYATSPLPQWSVQYQFTEKIIEIARNEPPEAEDENGITKYGTHFGDPDGQWCTEFALWCVLQAQESLGVEYINVYYPLSDYSGGCIQWYKKQKHYYTPEDYIPRRGDMIFFEYDEDNVSDHTGLVTGVEYDETEGKLYILTIEGNLPEDYPKGVIRERRLAADDKLIFGYGTFPYTPQPIPQQGDTP